MELLELPFEPASASVARRHVVHVLRTRGVEALTCEDAALIVSELVGNALRHGQAMRGGRLTVGWQFDEDGLRIEVSDGGGGRPMLRSTDALAAGGRGLEIVAALARAWGYAASDSGTTVWVQVGTRPVTGVLQGLDPTEYDATG
jgi:serine/threonine-protein kinase RsbW